MVQTASKSMTSAVAIEAIEAAAYTVPTDHLESDGTLQWDSTTLVVVHASAGDCRGVGYSYCDAAAVGIIREMLADRLVGSDASAVGACWAEMNHAIRNQGDSGLCAMAAAAVDNALWDLKARLLDVPLVTLLGPVRQSVPVYGSGGFTSYSDAQLRQQMAGYAETGMAFAKMKIGREPSADPHRVRAARSAVGPDVELFVDANGAYDRKGALAMADRLVELGVTWFEEPVYHRDLAGLRLIRDRAPAGMEVSCGEYGFQLAYFRHLLEAGAVDVLQADATRCGISGFLRAASLCEAHFVPLSSHCAPYLHLHVCCAAEPVRHMEYFHDHVRIERMLFDGPVEPTNGRLRVDMSRPGLGLEFKAADAEKFAH